jgi:hypothetical protein
MRDGARPLWQRLLYRAGLAPYSALEEVECKLIHTRGDLQQAQSRLRVMQHEIDELRRERAMRAYDDAKAAGTAND